MNKILKLCLVIALCAALLMMVGCTPKETDDNPTEQNTQNAGGENGGGNEGEVDQNPEGDPFDATGNGEEGDTKVTEPPVGVDDGNSKETEDDFVIDFGDLT